MKFAAALYFIVVALLAIALWIAAILYCIGLEIVRGLKRSFALIFISPFSSEYRCQNDMHDYMDGDLKYPWHMVNHRCNRCGKEFQV